MDGLGEALPGLVVAEGAHHLDLRSANPADPDSVKEVRLQEVNYLQTWLKALP
jgi:lysosomal Pro-X carboxypeptidase